MLRIFALALACVPTSALALTLEFTGLPDLGGSSYMAGEWEEAGFVVQGGAESFSIPDALHLDDSGTGYASQVSVSHLGRLFDLVAMDLTYLRQALYFTDPEDWDVQAMPLSYENVLIEGFLGGAKVAELMLSTDSSSGTITWKRVAMGSAFVGIDGFTISALFPVGLPEGAECYDVPCGHFWVDNIEIAPVPVSLPAVSLATGLAVLWTRRRRTVARSSAL
ncbi:hypothetical protein V8J36_05185 [Frigidibacter sp. MR17.14]|uniref:hypothetical protein n=1 Tax=Frigidibacter sp. MR17.14 TaxID=3126509 RepID=UPI003012B7E5